MEMKAPVLSAQLVWCYTIGGSFFSSFFPSLFWVQLRTLVFEKKFSFSCGTYENKMYRVTLVHTKMCSTSWQHPNCWCWYLQLMKPLVGTRTRFSKPAKHVFLQLHYRYKLIRTQKSCISSAQLKGPHASLSAHALQIAVLKCPHTTALVLCFIVFWLLLLTWTWLDTPESVDIFEHHNL